MSKQRIYASLLALGAAILLFRTIMMLAQGNLNILVRWVGGLLILEFLIDLGCFITALKWWLKNDIHYRNWPLRLGAVAAFVHAFRVMIFVLGRIGPWIDFDVQPGQKAMHDARWTWGGLYFAAIMSVLGVIGVLVIWYLIRRSRSRLPQSLPHE